MPVMNYETSVQLPTNGRLYGPGGPSEVVLRAITTREEKFLLGSSSSKPVDSIVEACIVEPKGLKLADLIVPDSNFLLYKLRIHTYGPLYDITTQCPNCRATNQNRVDLNDFMVYELDDDFQEPFEIELPKCGDTLTCRLMRKRDVEAVEDRARKIVRKTRGVTLEEVAYNMRVARHILKINDKEVTWDEAQQYTINMHGMDLAWFWKVLDDIKVGYDNTLDIDCEVCGNSYETGLPLTMDFFRPAFE